MSSTRVARGRTARATWFLAAASGALLLCGAASPGGAQAIPQPGPAKKAAQRAAAATNKHTEAVSGSAVTATPQAQQPRQGTGATKQQQSATRQTRGDSAAAAARADTSRRGGAQQRGSVSVSERGGRGEMTLQREVFDYNPEGRRDPFVSLMASGELRPLLTDLQLRSVIYDPSGRNSVAILRDAQTKDQYRVRVGQTLGRMRVTAIRPREVVFTIDEFGFNRQEVLTYTEPTTPRQP